LKGECILFWWRRTWSHKYEHVGNMATFCSCISSI